jgi:hypothetical protein
VAVAGVRVKGEGEGEDEGEGKGVRVVVLRQVGARWREQVGAEVHELAQGALGQAKA